MTKVNIESPMILNSKLIQANKLAIDSKVIHLELPLTENLKKIKEYNPNQLLSQSLNHMIKCLKTDLAKNPVFFSTAKIKSMDSIYMERFENNNTISFESLSGYK